MAKASLSVKNARIKGTLEDLTGLSDYPCGVRAYSQNHHELVVAVNDPDYTLEAGFCLWFPLTGCFEGPLQWVGADFCLGTRDEWEEILSIVRPSGDLKEEFIKHHVLFVLKRPAFRVRILAFDCHKVAGIPIIHWHDPDGPRSSQDLEDSLSSVL
ncbi:MAG: hypothetical protein SXV54_16425 [Chloroflexota bacterium]|nr:hypothetical protein [Chloroflexota bacterium]